MLRMWTRLKQHWVRHLLAALQVAVGVAAVSAVMIDIVPVLRQGAFSHEASLFHAFYGGRTLASEIRSSAFLLEDIDYVQERADSVAAAAIYEQLPTQLVQYGDERFFLRGIAQVSPSLIDIADIAIQSGRFFDAADAASAEPSVAVISADIAAIIFGDRDPIGETINLRPSLEAQRLRGLPFPGEIDAEGTPGLDVQVVGVFAYPEGTPVFAGPFSSTSRAEMFIPATGHPLLSLTGVRVFAESSAAPSPQPAVLEQYSRIYFRAVDGQGAEAAAELEALLSPRIAERRPGGFRAPGDPEMTLLIEPTDSGAASLRQSQLQGLLLLGAMGAAALVVSGFSIFTTFLASVAERVRAIGLARALGATRMRIVREVVGEAALLSSIGGAIGVAAAFPVRNVALRLFLMTSAPVGPMDVVITIALGVALACGIGAVAALYPGWTVARLMPAEAFYED